MSNWRKPPLLCPASPLQSVPSQNLTTRASSHLTITEEIVRIFTRPFAHIWPADICNPPFSQISVFRITSFIASQVKKHTLLVPYESKPVSVKDLIPTSPRVMIIWLYWQQFISSQHPPPWVLNSAWFILLVKSFNQVLEFNYFPIQKIPSNHSAPRNSPLL